MYDGYDLDKVAALEKAIKNAGTGASHLAPSVSTTEQEASHYLMLGYGVAPQAMRAEEAQPGTSDAVTTLDTLIDTGPTVSAEIGRRLAHLKACEAVQQAGFHVDPAHVFDDARPPDLARIRQAITDLRSSIDDKALMTGGPAAAYDALKDLSGVEAEAVFGTLSDEDMGTLQSYFAKHGLPMGRAVVPAGLTSEQKIALANSMFPELSQDMLKRLAEKLPALQPDYSGIEAGDDDITQGLHWRWVDGELVPQGASPGQIDQGDLGDCWFLAGLGAEVQKNPQFVQQHVRDNGNGTYTVTFYRDGKPQPVTVDSNLPYNQDDGTAFDHDYGGGKWVQIYEKAYAQYKGGYASIEGGWGDRSMGDLTGQSAHRYDSDDVDFDDLKKKYDSGHPVTIGSDTHHSGFLWHHSDEYFPGTKIVTAHEYVVVGFDGDHVKLRNPWGEDLTISKDQYEDDFREVAVGND